MSLAGSLQTSPWQRRDPTRNVGHITVDMIIAAVATEFAIDPSDITGQRRLRRYVVPRWAAIYLAKRLTRHSSVVVGRLIGGRDHTTVLHAENRAAALVNRDPEFAWAVGTVERQLRSVATVEKVIDMTGAEIRWRGKLPIPEHAGPLVRRLFEIMNDEMTALGEVAERSGIPRQTFWNWRTTTSPKVDDLQAALNVMDYEIVIRKRKAQP